MPLGRMRIKSPAPKPQRARPSQLSSHKRQLFLRLDASISTPTLAPLITCLPVIALFTSPHSDPIRIFVSTSLTLTWPAISFYLPALEAPTTPPSFSSETCAQGSGAPTAMAAAALVRAPSQQAGGPATRKKTAGAREAADGSRAYAAHAAATRPGSQLPHRRA